MWRVTPSGELVMVYASIVGDVISEEALPREKIWDWWDDTRDIDSDEALLDKAKGRLKSGGFKEGDVVLPMIDLRLYNIYTIHWPSNVAKLIFDNAWPEVLALKKEFLPITYSSVLEFILELAQAVDSIQDSTKLTQMVKEELDKARKEVGIE